MKTEKNYPNEDYLQPRCRVIMARPRRMLCQSDTINYDSNNTESLLSDDGEYDLG